jgi:hypothetical protein
MPTPTGCATCTKSSLSLLLLRPSPIARITEAAVEHKRPIVTDLIPDGSEAIESVAADVQGIMPGTPTESRIVLRTLRAGYVHIYLEEPSPKWIVYRVTEEGDMVPHEQPYSDMPKANFVCKYTAKHNPEGMKLVQIPQAHLTPTIWIAFSANLWTAKLRERNKKSPEQMQQINLRAKSPNTFLPSAENLKKRVLECGLPTFVIDKKSSHDYPFTPIKDVDKLANELVKAARCHKVTAGKELAIVLSDPVGLASELCALRLHRFELMKKEFVKPMYEHPLQSSNTLLGLKSMTRQDGYERATKNLLHVVTYKAFEKDYKNSKNPSLAGAEWEEIKPKKLAVNGEQLGRVWTIESKKQYENQAKRFREANWARISSEYNEAARLKWHEDFEAKMQALHLDSTAKFENDWWRVCRHERYKSYFSQHFDEDDKNDPKLHHSPGLVYASEVTRSKTPQPMTTGAVLDDYVEQLFGEISDPAAHLLRAMGANQKSVMAAIEGVTNVKVITDHLHKERNDKLYDFGAALVQGAHDARTPNKVQKAIVQYSWLSNTLGDTLSGYSLLINESLVAAAFAIGARIGVGFFSTAKGIAALNFLKSYSMIQLTTDYALHSVVARSALKTPIIITKRFPVGQALHLLGARGGFSTAQILGAMTSGMIDLELITDPVEMRGFAGDIDEAVKQGAGRVRVEPLPALLASARPERTVRFTEATWIKAWERQGHIRSKATFWVTEGLRDGHATLRSLEGRLAICVMIINGVQLVQNVEKWNKSKTEGESESRSRAMRDALLGGIDSTASVVGGLCQLSEVFIKSSVVGRLGAPAATKSFAINGLRGLGMGLGAFAGVVTSVHQVAKAVDAHRSGHTGVGNFYLASATAFLGTGVTGSLAIAGVYGDHMVAKTGGSLLARRLALRYGVQGTAMLMGLTISGWGIVLLTVGVAFEVGAVMMTPSEIQKWAQRSYFGYGKGDEPKFAKGDWASEKAALSTLVQISVTEVIETADAAQPAK